MPTLRPYKRGNRKYQNIMNFLIALKKVGDKSFSCDQVSNYLGESPLATKNLLKSVSGHKYNKITKQYDFTEEEIEVVV